LFVPPPSVRAYALDHARDPEEPVGDIEIEVEIEEDPAEASARETMPPEASLVRATTPPGAREGSDDVATEQQMFDHLAAKEYAAALMLAESLLGQDPAHPRALLCSEKCRVLVERVYLVSLGSSERIPRLMVDPKELRTKALDPRAGFLLSQVDGRTSIEMLLDLGTMPRLETLRLLYELTIDGVIEMTG
jgi:hypothetical protein